MYVCGSCDGMTKLLMHPILVGQDVVYLSVQHTAWMSAVVLQEMITIIKQELKLTYDLCVCVCFLADYKKDKPQHQTEALGIA